MAQKLFSTGPGIFRMAEQKETIDGLEHSLLHSLFHSEMVLGKNEYLYQSTQEEKIVNVSEEIQTGRQSESHGIAERP